MVYYLQMLQRQQLDTLGMFHVYFLQLHNTFAQNICELNYSRMAPELQIPWKFSPWNI